MDLSKKQKEIIKAMRNGVKVVVTINIGNKANKYYLGNSIKPMRRRPIIDLWDDNILYFKTINYCTGEFTLTELGNSIDL